MPEHQELCISQRLGTLPGLWSHPIQYSQAVGTVFSLCFSAPELLERYDFCRGAGRSIYTPLSGMSSAEEQLCLDVSGNFTSLPRFPPDRPRVPHIANRLCKLLPCFAFARPIEEPCTLRVREMVDRPVHSMYVG